MEGYERVWKDMFGCDGFGEIWGYMEKYLWKKKDMWGYGRYGKICRDIERCAWLCIDTEGYAGIWRDNDFTVACKGEMRKEYIPKVWGDVQIDSQRFRKTLHNGLGQARLGRTGLVWVGFG